MKHIFYTIIYLFLFTTANAQNKNDFTRNQKKLIKKAVFVELWDISGEKHEGFLWYVDSTFLTLSTKKYSGDTLIMIKAEYIYKTIFTQKDKYGKKFIRHLMFFTSASGLVTALSYTGGGAVMIGPIFIFIILEVVYGVPASLITAVIPYKRKRTYKVFPNKDKFYEGLEFMQRKKLSKIAPANEYKIILEPKMNPSKLFQLERKKK